MLHLYAAEPLHIQEKPPGQENDDRKGDDQGKNITRGHNDIVEDAQETEYLFSPRYTINHHFYTADQDHTESPEYQGMQQSHYGPPEDLGLADSDFQHEYCPLSDLPHLESRFGKFKEADKPAGCYCKGSDGKNQSNDENNLFYHIKTYWALAVLISLIRSGNTLAASPMIP